MLTHLKMPLRMNSNKKSCIVVTCFDENQPGFLDFSYRIKVLAARYQLTVISTFNITQAELVLDNINYIVINAEKSRIGWLKYLWRCVSCIRQRQPNLIMLLHSMAAPVALLVYNIPTITYWNEHPTHVAPVPKGVSFIKYISRWVIRWLMYQGAVKSTLTMPIGEAHQRDLIAHGCNINKLQMIYMGVEQSFYKVAESKKPRLADAPLQLLYVGSVQKDRGRDVMLEAIAMANRVNKIAHLTIVGASDEQMKICQEVIKTLSTENDVTIHGRVPGSAVPNFMANADVGLCIWDSLPWYKFNPPTKLFEYLVAGLPVMASNITTHTQYVKDGVNGMLFEYDSASLADAIKRLWQNRADLLHMKQRTGNNSAAYLWDNIEPQFINAIDRVVHK